jgi:hypothetical protein
MAEKRRRNRVNLVLVGKLLCNDTVIDCQLENISLDGALITARGSSLVELGIGDVCTLLIPQEIDNLNVTIQAEVVHVLFAFVGLRFSGLSLQTYSQLEYVIQQERAKQEYLGVSENSCITTPGSVS